MPIGNNYSVKPNKMKKFYPVPADKYQIEITDVNLVTEVSPFSGKEEDRLKFEFTILDSKNFDYVDEEGEKQIESTRGRRIWMKISPMLSASSGGRYKASWFYKLVCAVERNDIKPEDLVEIVPDTLIGAQLCAFIEVKDQWNNVASLMAAEKPMPAVPTVYDREDKNAAAQSTGKDEPVQKEADPAWVSEKQPNEGTKEEFNEGKFLGGLEEDKNKTAEQLAAENKEFNDQNQPKPASSGRVTAVFKGK